MYYIKIEEVLKVLKTSQAGLDTEEAKRRLKEYGTNELQEGKKATPSKILLNQFKDPLIFILIFAILISAFIKEISDAILIGCIVILNATIGFFQEYKAEKAFELLKKMSAQSCKVIRDGKEAIIESKLLVPGDVIILESGDKIAADARLIEAVNLEVDEAALTGESVSIKKEAKIVAENTPMAERANMVFAGTTVNIGRGKGAVVSTGMNTEFGKIANLIQTISDTTTPLQKRLKELSKMLGIIILAICIIILIIGLFAHINFFEMLITSISLAVSAIPEGLPAVVTICLALGLRRMLKRNALIRQLKAVETLGSVTVICTDKTGTLTKNEMTVTRLFVNNQDVEVSGSGYETNGSFKIEGKIVTPTKFGLLLKIAASCNDATLEIGDPTEKALIVVGEKGKVKKDEARVSEISFDSDKKYMATFHKNGFGYIKGAPEKVIEMCSHIQVNDTRRRLTQKDKAFILEKNKEMAHAALRVLAFAYTKERKVKDLTFVGLMGMIDPPRDEAKDAINLCEKAGIKPVMITGDHEITAKAVGEMIGLKGEVIKGSIIEHLSEKQLQDLVKCASIFARVSSEQKVKILLALQKNGEVVAMTGDGVNDAPALKQADVGVAMNLKGTDVSKEAADMTLLDDNFATIVSAVKEGRIIYDNIKKFIKFLLAANLGEVLLVLLALIMKLPLPLLPIQILWVNLITDSLPALALGIDPPDPKIMEKKPRAKSESIFKDIKFFMIFAGVLAFVASITAFLIYYLRSGDVVKARTAALTTIVLFELFFVFSCRSEKLTLFKIGLFSNRYLIGAVLISVIAQLVILYTPLNSLFKVVSLGLYDWLIVLGLASIGLVFFELKKAFFIKNDTRAVL